MRQTPAVGLARRCVRVTPVALQDQGRILLPPPICCRLVDASYDASVIAPVRWRGIFASPGRRAAAATCGRRHPSPLPSHMTLIEEQEPAF
jgi:hypothetical protein